MKDSDNWLNAVEIIGKILILTPIIVSFPLIIYAILTGVNVSIGEAKAGYSAGLMIVAGIIALIYSSIKRFKEGKRIT
ncbi:MAG: hypothetical protein SCH70_13560 [Candidatus Methanoperedens sp.]|nr:hypothetical protein [Candidatus Methanoperedens sp.]